MRIAKSTLRELAGINKQLAAEVVLPPVVAQDSPHKPRGLARGVGWGGGAGVPARRPRCVDPRKANPSGNECRRAYLHGL